MDEELRDPLVGVLTERCADAIRRERAAEDEVVTLKLEVGRLKAVNRQIRRQLDMMIEREAARYGPPADPRRAPELEVK